MLHIDHIQPPMYSTHTHAILSITILLHIPVRIQQQHITRILLTSHISIYNSHTYHSYHKLHHANPIHSAYNQTQ